ncbi:MAG: phosphotransferase family protein [Acutalibacteraceae bacterium]
MISKTKYPVTESEIVALFKKAGFSKISDIEPLGDGEYNSVFSVNADGKSYALKIAPSPDCEVLTYEKGMMKSEIYWYEQIHSRTDINVPAVIFSDFSRDIIKTDWFIMEKINGKSLRHCKLQKAEKEESEKAVIDMAAAMHNICGTEFGYPEGEKFSSWYEALKHIINNLIGDCEKKGFKCKNGERMLKALEKHKEVFMCAECNMVNFDLHTGNIIYDPESKEKYCLIDLERGLWGDRIIEFVNLDFINPIEKKTKILEYYNSVADKKIVVDKSIKLRYAMGQALLSLIMETEKYYRYTRLNFGWWRNVGACVFLYKAAFGVLENE